MSQRASIVLLFFFLLFQALSSLCRLQSPPPTNSSVSRQFGHAVRVLKGCTHTRTPCCTRKKTCIPPVVWISSCALICDVGNATCVLVELSLHLEESGFAADIHLRLCPSPEDTCTHTHTYKNTQDECSSCIDLTFLLPCATAYAFRCASVLYAARLSRIHCLT